MYKSQLVQFLLALFFGPLGLFYSSTAAALFWIILAIVIGFVTLGLGFVGIWLLSIVTGFFTVSGYNQRMKAIIAR